MHANLVMPLMREALKEPNLTIQGYRLLHATYMDTYHRLAPLVGRTARPGFKPPTISEWIQLGRQMLTVIKPIALSGFDDFDGDDGDDE